MARKRRILIVANRLPVRRSKGRGVSWETSPGGLVAALTPLVRDTGGSWIGWTGQPGAAPEAFDHEGIRNVPLPISAAERDGFYFGFSNKTLWPLYHDAVREPSFHRRWWWPYVDVNQRFADAAASAARGSDAVWVHDYQLQLVPGMLRERRPRLRIGFFLHIPFPPEELFAQLPWRRQILEGLLGADVVGFQTRLGSQNFSRAARRYTSATGTDALLNFLGREIRVEPFPISIDVGSFERLARSPDVVERSRELRRRLEPSRRIVLGVDRLDYTKGIDIRLRAYEDSLAERRVTVQDCVMVQVAVPSREDVSEYQDLRTRVEQIVGRINGEYGEAGMAAVHYLRRNLPPEELVAYYLAADVMLVTPLRDGMNLIAKEYPASRLDNTGVMVLSEFTGAARELRSAVLVNPHDIDGVSAAIGTALNMPAAEARRRMSSMRRAIKRNDVFHWADGFLEALLA